MFGTSGSPSRSGCGSDTAATRRNSGAARARGWLAWSEPRFPRTAISGTSRSSSTWSATCPHGVGANAKRSRQSFEQRGAATRSGTWRSCSAIRSCAGRSSGWEAADPRNAKMSSVAPVVSVLIASDRVHGSLPDCLSSLERQQRAPAFEVVDESLGYVGEDTDFVHRALALGLRVRLDPAVRVRHRRRAFPARYLAQRWRYRVKTGRLFVERPGLYSGRRIAGFLSAGFL